MQAAVADSGGVGSRQVAVEEELSYLPLSVYSCARDGGEHE